MAVLNYFSVPDILYLQSYICKVKLLSISDAYYLNVILTYSNFHMNLIRQFMHKINIFVLYMYFVATKIYSHLLA